VGELEDLVVGLGVHDVPDRLFVRVALLDETLPERHELLLVASQLRLFHERLGELLRVETPRLDQPRPELLVCQRQRDSLHVSLDEVDEPVLLEVPDLEHAGGDVLREELQNAGEVESVD
jgi:hypothetical protein